MKFETMHTSHLVMSVALTLLLAACGGGGSERLTAPPAIVISAPESVGIGARVVITADAQDRDGGEIVSRTWEQTAGPELQLSGFEDEIIEFSAPRTTTSEEVTLEHCVTDDERDVACEEVSVLILSAVDLGLRGGIRSIIDTVDGSTGLPRDEASLRELHNGRFNSDDWSPQHATMLMTALVIGHALTEEEPVVFEALELDDEGLLERFDDLLVSLERIVQDRSRHFPARDFLAFYHIYDGRVPQSDSLGRFVSFEDNAMLYAGLTVAEQYLVDVDLETATRVREIRDKLDLSLWVDADGRISKGTTELPLDQEKLDRFLSEQRISVLAARADGALTTPQLEALVDELVALSVRDDEGLLLPPIGKMVEVYGPVPWLGERETVLVEAVLGPLYQAHVISAGRLGVPVSHTSVPVVQRRSVEYALSPFEGVDELLEEFQDLPVITPPGAAMATAIGSDESLENYEEAVLIVENESEGGIDGFYGPPAVFDFGVTATVPEDVSPMYGTLQTGFAVAALATNRLEPYFLVDLLRRDDGWDEAIREYRNLLIDRFGP